MGLAGVDMSTWPIKASGNHSVVTLEKIIQPSSFRFLLMWIVFIDVYYVKVTTEEI